VLDNLTTSIVMASLLRRLVHEHAQRLVYVGMVVIAANAGGAWSPIGDVTTTMLWIGGQISAAGIVEVAFVPSVLCLLVPLLLVMPQLGGVILRAPDSEPRDNPPDRVINGSRRMLVTGLGMLLFVPVFKVLTHLPPFMGMMLGLAVVWALSELLHLEKTEEERRPYTAIHAMSRIDVSAILFFLGILLAVGVLQGTGVLRSLTQVLDSTFQSYGVIAVLLGLLSAIIDNVPLIAAVQHMYEQPLDHPLWGLMAYTAGTGGSCLIIGSAAGVALMGMERINFFWYLRSMSWLALAGYLAGAAYYIFLGAAA
jgi:Na+/H+ antiporter NhaD/arsenite permease-like protein